MIKIPVQVNPSTLVNLVFFVSPLSSQYLNRTDDRENADKNVFSEGCYSSQYQKSRLENIDCTLCFHRIIAQNSSFVAIPYTISHSVGNNHCTTDGNGMIPYKYSVDNQLGS
jgi:hypothetical protein